MGSWAYLRKKEIGKRPRGPFAAARAGGAGGGFFSEIRFPISFFRIQPPTGPGAAAGPGREAD